MSGRIGHAAADDGAPKVEQVKTHGLKALIPGLSEPAVNLSDEAKRGPASSQGEKYSDDRKIAGLQESHSSNSPESSLSKSSSAKSFVQQLQQHPRRLFSIEGGALLGFLGIVVAIVFLFGSKLARLVLKLKNPLAPDSANSSTRVFLKLSDDLRRLKILRRPSDTADELSQRFFESFSENEPCHPDLPVLFREFVNLYSEARFGVTDKDPERLRRMRQLSLKIQELARLKSVSKAS
jgi:hypothetical protein